MPVTPATPIPLPPINSNPLHNRPQTPSSYDDQRLWEAVQKLQADVNTIIQHLADKETTS